MVKDKELTDDPPFVDISVDHKGGGIEVKLDGARAIVLNEHDAQFLCDSLYVMLDNLDQVRRDAEEESDETP